MRAKDNEPPMIELDGTTGEGGGQILRSGLALSMCTGQPVRFKHIRAKRTKPGLMRQHLTCVQAAAKVCSATVEGDGLGSTTLVFEPGPVRAGDYVFQVDTAGSCTLVLQTVLPALMRAAEPSRVTLGGGTHNPMAPPFQFLQRGFAHLLRRLGVGLDLTLRRHGFYPAGGGEVVAEITPAAPGLTPVDMLQRGPLLASYAEWLAPALPRSVAQRELSALGEALNWAPSQLLTPAVRQNEGPGNALMATLVYQELSEVFTCIGEKGQSAERVAELLAQEVRQFEGSRGALGPYLADQWMLPLALALCDSHQAVASARFTCTEWTDHARSNAGVIEAFLPVRFSTKDEKDHCAAQVHMTNG
jgi:RNA 3'-terminal phosphate cyclase (ATP)